MKLTIQKNMILLSAIMIIIMITLSGFTMTFLNRAFEHGRHDSEAINLSRSLQVQFKTQVQEWKNTLLRGSDKEAFEKHWKAFLVLKDEVNTTFNKVETKFAEQGADTAVVKEAHKAYDEMMVRYVDAIKSYDAADLNSALAVDRLVKGVDREPTRMMDEIVTSYRQHAEYLYQTEIKFNFYVLLGVFLVSILAAATALYVTFRAVMTPLRSLKSMFSTSAQVVKASTNQMEQAVSSMVAASEETSAQSVLVKTSSTHASKYVSDVSTAVLELNESIRDIAKNAAASTDIVENTVALARKTDEVVVRLDETSQKISEVVNLINELASQTNLLALNAAIEAARAGEAGRGFAVVADEVKKLAGNTGQATVDIAEHVKTIQTVSQACVRALHEVVSSISDVKNNAASVSAAVEQQGAVTNQIAKYVQDAAQRVEDVDHNMVGIEQAANDTSVSADQVHQAVTDLNKSFDLLQAEMSTTLCKIGIR